MYHSEILINIADELNNMDSVNEVGKYYEKTLGTFEEEPYNLSVFLLGMCINKELTIMLAEAQDVSVEGFPEKLKMIYNDILEKYRQYNRLIAGGLRDRDDKQFFLIYLDDITERLLSGIKYMEKKAGAPWQSDDECNEWNTGFRREERIRDRMKHIIASKNEFTKFTIKNRIELPYMYVLAWDLPNMMNVYGDRKKPVGKGESSYYALLPENMRVCLESVNDDTLEILLYGALTAKDRFEDDSPDAAIKILKRIDFSQLLPTITEVEKKSGNSVEDLADKSSKHQARKTHILPYIKKEVLSKKPLVPMEIAKSECNLKLLGMLVDVLKEENRTNKLNQELHEKNRELQQLNLQRKKMIDHLEHSWGNECYPQIVKNVADELLKNGNDSLANKLFKAYNSENNMMGEIIFLQSVMSDEPDELKKIFSNSFYISGSMKKEYKVISVIEDALEILVFGLLNYDGNNRKRVLCRNKLCCKHSLQEQREDYADRFEKQNAGNSIVEWFDERVFSLKITIDKTWDGVNFGKTEYGKIVMKNIFTEIFTNALFHGKDFCEMDLVSEADKLAIIVRNRISDAETGNEKGLSSMKEIISKLNYDTSVLEEEGIAYGLIDDSVFETRVTLAKELMYIDGEW